MRVLTFYFLLFVTLMSGTCAKSKHAVNSDPLQFSATDYIKLKKFKCRGNCQVYELTVSGDGSAVLFGEENILYMGTYKKDIGKEKAGQMLLRMNTLIPDLKNEYLPVVSDYHIIETSASIGGRQKKVKCEYNAPGDFVSLIRDMEALVSTGGWRKQ